MAMTGQRSPLAAAILGGSTIVVSLLPVFLAGAMAVQLTEELAFGAAGLGGVVALFRGMSAVTSASMGRLADRIGATWSIRIVAVIAATTSLSIATLAHDWLSLAACMLVGGTTHALAQPASNRLLVGAVPPERLGTAFGIKQSAPPATSMLAGFAVPLIALTWGWRSAYFIAACLAVTVIIAAGRRPTAQRTPARERRGRVKLEARGTIMLFAVAFALASAANSSITTFYVDAAVRAGSSQHMAGVLLALGSIGAIIARVISGFACDRIRTGHLQLAAALLAVGSLGTALLAVGRPTPMAGGVLLALASGWGFNAVFWYSLVRMYPKTPGAITGALAPGGLLGSTIGPIVFGFMADGPGYQVVWPTIAVVTVLAAVAMYVGARRLPAPEQSGADASGGPADD